MEKVTQKDILEVLDEEVLWHLFVLKICIFKKKDGLFRKIVHGHDDAYPHKITLPEKAGMAWSMHTKAKSFADFAIALSQIMRCNFVTRVYTDLHF